MALSKQTLDHLLEAESHLRAAIKSAATNEKPLVVQQLSKLLLERFTEVAFVPVVLVRICERLEELIGVAIGVVDAVQQVADDLLPSDVVALRFSLVGGASKGFAEVLLDVLRLVPNVGLQNNLEKKNSQKKNQI